jgi:uncharacterized protein (TIGR01777 family)
MRVFLTGGTGLIGRQLVKRLLERGDQPVVLTRQADKVRRDPALRAVRFVQGDPSASGSWASEVEGCDAVVNLVGHNIFADRWSARVKRTIRDSRVYATEHVAAAIAAAGSRPKVLVQASAIGYYGPHGDEPLTESSPSGSDFMAVVCREWEDAAAPVESLGVRLATIRTGIVLAKGEGALGTMAKFFRLPLAAPVGTGRQWMSWIHIDDIVGILLLALDNPEARGPINGTAPNPARNAEFSRALAKALWGTYLTVPGPPNALLQLMLGDVAQVILTGQKVLPEKAQALGYPFRHPELAGALAAVFARVPKVKEVLAAKTVSAGHH